MAVHTVYVDELLSFFEVANPHRAYGFASDLLVFSQSDAALPLHGHAPQTLAFRETAYLSGDQSRAVSQTLAFHDRADRTAIGYAYQNLTWVETAYLGVPSAGAQTLLFSESVTFGKVRSAGDTLVFTDVASARMVRNLPAGDTLVFSEGAVLFAPSAGFYATPDPVLPLGPTPTVTFSTPAGSMTLPAPDFGDTEALGQTRVSRNSRGGTFIIFRDPLWPATDEFDLTFSYLSEAQVARLRALVSASVGLLCTYTDREGRSWQVVVTNPELTASQVGRSNYTVPLKLLVAH